jgi:hypothetical protein
LFIRRCKARIEWSKRKREAEVEETIKRPVVVVIDHYKEKMREDWTIIKETEGEGREEQVSVESAEWRTNEVTIPMSTCLSLFFLYVVGGSIFFSWCEDWNYLDGSYFCFVSLVTIGFGDLVPGQTLGSQNAQRLDGQLILCSIYILLGMALMAMCFHLTQERFFIAAKKLGKALHLT